MRGTWNGLSKHKTNSNERTEVEGHLPGNSHFIEKRHRFTLNHSYRICTSQRKAMSSACLRFTTRSGIGSNVRALSTTRLTQHPARRTLLASRSRTHRYNNPQTTSPSLTPTRTFTTTMLPKAEIPPLNKAPGTGPLPIRPSSSVILLSPANQVLLLHRVAKSTSFASAHVFPGGNLSSFHEGDDYPLPKDAELHRDSEAYRLAAVRETFEESGILLARRQDGGGLLELSEEELEEGRREVFGDRVKFTAWLEGKGGEADIGEFRSFCFLVLGHNRRRERGNE